MANHFDPVNKPDHYTFGGIEAIEGVEASMSQEAFHGWLKGNILTYVWRYERKNGLEDLLKARWNLDRLIESIESKVTPAQSEVRLDKGCLGASFYEQAKQILEII